MIVNHKLNLFLLFTLLFGFSGYGQDSLQIVEWLNNIPLDQQEHDFGNDSIFIQQIEVSPNHLKIDSVSFDNSRVDDVLKGCKMEHLLEMEQNEIIVIKNKNETQYYRCFELDSVDFLKCALISIYTEWGDEDSIYSIIKNELNSGKDWNALKYHFSDCFPSGRRKPIRGITGWVHADRFLEPLKKAMLDLKIGEITLIKFPEYELTCVVLKIDNIKKFAVRKVKLVSVPRN